MRSDPLSLAGGAASRAFEWRVLEALPDHAARRPADLAVRVIEGRQQHATEYSVLDLWLRVSAVSEKLRARLQPGDRALIILPTGIDYVAAFLGCLLSRTIAVPLYPPANKGHLPRLLSIIRDSDASMLLTSEAERQRVERLLGRDDALPIPMLALDAPAPHEDGDAGPAAGVPAFAPASPAPWQDIAFLQYTSGSTGDAKGVAVSFANLATNARLLHGRLLGDVRGPFLSWLPLFHDLGLIGCLLQSLVWGDPITLMSPASFLQRPLHWLRRIAEHRVLRSGAPNFAYELCASSFEREAERASGPTLDLSTLDLSSWRVAFCGAEPIRRKTLERFAACFRPFGFDPAAFMPAYGLAESTLFVSGMRLGERRIGPAQTPGGLADAFGEGDEVTCCQPAEETVVRIVDPETRQALPAGKSGEIWVSGPQVATGYWRRPDLSRDVFEARLAGDADPLRYLRTGDVGRLVDGELFVSGRIKEILIFQGGNHFPTDIEQTVMESCDSVRTDHVMAIAVPCGRLDGLAILCEARRNVGIPALEAAIPSIRRAVAATHGVAPQVLAFLPQGRLPKTTSGKLRRREAARQFERLLEQAILSWADPALQAEKERAS